jgi:hypothetical protein
MKELLTGLKDKWLLIHRKRFQSQTEVNGGSFPNLRLKTIIRKQNSGSSISHNAFQRMIRTGDFVRHAFYGTLEQNGLTFAISDQPYRAQKTQEARERILTRMKQGKKVSKKAMSKAQHSDFTYRDLAAWQLSKSSPFSKGSFSKKGISSHNPGADFFGLSKKEAEESFKYLERKSASLARQNIEGELNKMIVNARNK